MFSPSPLSCALTPFPFSLSRFVLVSPPLSPLSLARLHRSLSRLPHTSSFVIFSLVLSWFQCRASRFHFAPLPCFPRRFTSSVSSRLCLLHCFFCVILNFRFFSCFSLLEYILSLSYFPLLCPSLKLSLTCTIFNINDTFVLRQYTQ